MKPNQTVPRKYGIACPPACQLNPDKIGEAKAEALLSLKEAGLGVKRFRAQAEPIIGYFMPEGSVSRHLLHYRPLEDELAQPTEGGTERRASDVEILDAVIQSAWKNRAHWKPSLRDMLEAMAKKHSITGGSEASDLMRLFDEAADEETVEAPEAVLSADELPTEDSDDLADG